VDSKPSKQAEVIPRGPALFDQGDTSRMSEHAPVSRREQVRIATDALNGEDFAVLATVFDPELEHESVFGALEGEIYRGLEGQRTRWKNVTETWADFRIDLIRIREVDAARAVVVLRLTGTARASGLPLDTELAQLWTWRGERVLRIVTFPDVDDANEAARAE